LEIKYYGMYCERCRQQEQEAKLSLG